MAGVGTNFALESSNANPETPRVPALTSHTCKLNDEQSAALHAWSFEIRV